MAYDQFGNYIPIEGSGSGIMAQSSYNPNANATPFGYSTQPGSGSFWEQQTPVGSFAAANQQFSSPQQRQATMYGTAQQASSPYIGMTTQGIGYQPSMMQYAQSGQYSNPWLGQTSQQSANVGANPYGMGNPYLQNAIDATSADVTKNFNNSVMPGLDRIAQASGSFGNSGVQQLQGQAYSDLGKNLGNISSGMRMQDYTQQQNLAENALGRQQQNNQFNSSLGAQDLARNLGGGFQQSALNNGLIMQAGQFDANMANNVGQFNANLAQNDLNRNTNASLGLGTFNAGQANGMSQFNAGQGNAANQFWGQLGQQNNQFNSGQGNALNMFNAGAGNSMLSQYRNNLQNQNQFDDTLNWNIDQGNWNRQHTGTQDQINLLGTLMGWNQNGINNAGTIQNTPLNYLQQFAGIGSGLGGMGGTGTNSQNLQGNPLLGALGGWQLFSQLFGNGNGNGG